MKDKREREEDDLKRRKKRSQREIKAKDEESDDDAGWETVKKGSSMPMVCFYCLILHKTFRGSFHYHFKSHS